MRKSVGLIEPDVFDILSATWVLASNDENPIVTYAGIRHRLGLGYPFDVASLVRSRGDLFRQGVPEVRFQSWKQEMLDGKHRPSWINDMAGEEERVTAINSLTSQGAFRSQFRSAPGAPPSSIEVIDWGLQHIDRLRKASAEASQRFTLQFQIYLVTGIGILNVIATIVAAILKK